MKGGGKGGRREGRKGMEEWSKPAKPLKQNGQGERWRECWGPADSQLGPGSICLHSLVAEGSSFLSL